MLEPAEDFRSLETVMKPDPRMEGFSIFDEIENGFRTITISDQFNSLENLKLHNAVPEHIRIHFATAKNLLLYSWYVYRFIPVAEMHAYSTVEMALKDISGKKRCGLRKLLEHAVENKLISDKGFRIHRELELRNKRGIAAIREIEGPDDTPEEEKERRKYVEILLEVMPKLRNAYAHGSKTIHPNGFLTLEICSEKLNQLYD